MIPVLCLIVTFAVLFSASTKDQKKDVPAAVISAFEKAYPGAKVKGYLAEAGNGKMHYEIESVKGKTTIDALLHPDGTFFEVEEGMAAKNLPANVSGEVTSKYPKAKFAKVEMVTRETEITYDMSLTEGKSKIRLTLDPNEKI